MRTVFLPSPHRRNPRLKLIAPMDKVLAPPTPLNTFLLTLFAKAERSIRIQTPNVTAPPVLSNFPLSGTFIFCHVHFLAQHRLTKTFTLWNIHSLEHSLSRTFTLWNIHALEHSRSGTFTLWNIHAPEHSRSGTFTLWNIRENPLPKRPISRTHWSEETAACSSHRSSKTKSAMQLRSSSRPGDPFQNPKVMFA
jgi:hypothetical protein